MKYNLFNNARLNSRLATLEKNIKSESNSFYDSFLDLLESTVKYILDEEDKTCGNARTVGEILRVKDIDDFFKNKVLFPYLDMLKDYVLKCNKHKHENEKKVSIETVISYLRVYFEFINKYLSYKNQPELKFDLGYYHSLYGQTLKENATLNKKVASLIADLKEAFEQNKLSEQDMERMRTIVSQNEDALTNIEEQNLKLMEKIDELKDIKINSMESKLNKTISLLLDLKEDIAVNKTLSKAVGRSIMGDKFDDWVKDEIKGDK